LRKVVVVAENEEAGKLLNYLLAYNKLAGLTKHPETVLKGAIEAPVYVIPALEVEPLKAKTG